MTTPWTEGEPSTAGDAFKIQKDCVLEEAFGVFVEEVMAHINDERNKLGLPKFQFFIYDIYITPEDPQQIKTAADKSWRGEPWEIEDIINNPLNPGDTQRLPFTPAFGGNQLNGFDSFIRNYITDIRDSLNDVTVTGDPLNISNGLANLLGFDLDDNVPNAAPLTTNPELEVHLNELRLKATIGCMVNGKEIHIYNVIPMPGGKLQPAKSLINQFKLRDINGVLISGGQKAFIRDDNIFVSFDKKVKKFTNYGKQILWPGGESERTLLVKPSKFVMVGDVIHYIQETSPANSYITNSSAAVNITQTIKQFKNVGREYRPVITPVFQGSVLFTEAAIPVDIVVGQVLYFGLADKELSDPVGVDSAFDAVVQDFDMDEVLRPGLEIGSTAGILFTKSGKIYGIKNTSLSEANPNLPQGTKIISEIHNPESFNDIMVFDRPKQLFFFTNTGSKPTWESNEATVWINLPGNGSVKYRTSLRPNLNISTAGMTTTRKYDKDKDEPTSFVEPLQFSLSGVNIYLGKEYVFDGPNNGDTGQWRERETHTVFQLDMGPFLDEIYTNKSFELVVSFDKKSFARIVFVDHDDSDGEDFVPPTGGPPFPPGFDFKTLVLDSQTINCNVYTGPFPPTDVSHFNLKGALLGSSVLSNVSRYITADGQPSLKETYSVPASLIPADGILNIMFSPATRSDFQTTGLTSVSSRTFAIGISANVEAVIANFSN